LTAWLARIPERIGYARDGRSWLLTRAIRRPEPGDIPRHERFYYLELLRRAGLIEHFPESSAFRLRAKPARHVCASSAWRARA
jgi:heptosyltransferase-2